MKALDIISQIDCIYKSYNISKNLQQHLKSVSAIAELISDKWTGPSIDKNEIIVALLVHNLQEDLDEYGENNRQGTLKILQELKIEQSIIKLVDEHIFMNATKILTSTDFNLKIALYADLRANHTGVVMLKERFANLKRRYKATLHKRYPNFEELEFALYKIEAEIFAHIPIIAEEINDFTVGLILDKRDARLDAGL